MLPSLSPPNERYMDPPRTPPTKAMRTQGKAVTHTELHRAVLRNNGDLVRRVLLRGAGPWGHANVRDWWGRTPLHRAAERNYIPILIELIQRGGADVNAQETQWLRTSLHVAAERGFDEACASLLAHGADPNLVDRQGWSPLLLACEKGHAIICQHLLEAGSRVEVRSNQDMNALHLACRDGNIAIVRLLLDVRKRPHNNSDVEARSVTKDGVTTPLHLAARGGHEDCVRALLEQSADVNVRDHMGWAPLHAAAWYCHVQAAAVLMGHPTCKLDIVSIEGETAYDLARRRKRQGELEMDRKVKKEIPAHMRAGAKVAFSLFGQKQQIEQKLLDEKNKKIADDLELQVRRSLAFFRTAYTDRDAAMRAAAHAATMSGHSPTTMVATTEGMDGPVTALVVVDRKEEEDGSSSVLDWENGLREVREKMQGTVGRLLAEQKWAKSAGLGAMIELLQHAERTCEAAARTTAASVSLKNGEIFFCHLSLSLSDF